MEELFLPSLSVSLREELLYSLSVRSQCARSPISSNLEVLIRH